MAPEIVQELPYNETVDLWYLLHSDVSNCEKGRLVLFFMNCSTANLLSIPTTCIH